MKPRKKYKIAICFRGLAKGASKRSVVRGFEGWDSIVQSIVQDHDVDVFCHSWSVDVKDKIIDTYNPKKYIIEEQIVFDKDYSEEIEGDKETKHLWSPHVALSQIYSLCRGIELKTEYEKKNGFKYDYVFCLRYDMHFLNKFDYSLVSKKEKYRGTLIHARNTRRQDERRNINKVNFPYLKRSVRDLYWCSDSDTINKLGTAYEVLTKMKHRPYSIHKTWDLFFQTIGFDREKLLQYPKRKSICKLTRDFSRRRPNLVIDPQRPLTGSVFIDEDLI